MPADSASFSSRLSATIRQFVPGNPEQPSPPTANRQPPTCPKQATAAAATRPPQPSAPASADTSPPALAIPPKPASAAPAVEVWERGDKHARGVYVEAPGLVPVKGHVRAAPGTAVAETAEKGVNERLPVTREAIVKEYGKNERQSTRRTLFVGRLVHIWIQRQPERPADEQLDRASALKILRKALIDAKYDRRSCRVDRDLRCYHVTRLLGGEAESLSISAIREMQPLVERDKTASERWQLVPAYAEAAKALWARMLAEKLSGDAVRLAVDKILHPNPLPLEVQRKKSRLARLLKILPVLSIEELAQLIRRAKEERAKSQPGSKPAAA